MRPKYDYPKLANQFGVVWSPANRVKSFWKFAFVESGAQIHDEIEVIVLAPLCIVRYIRLKCWIISADAVVGLLDFHLLLLLLTATSMLHGVPHIPRFPGSGSTPEVFIQRSPYPFILVPHHPDGCMARWTYPPYLSFGTDHAVAWKPRVGDSGNRSLLNQALETAQG